MDTLALAQRRVGMPMRQHLKSEHVSVKVVVPEQLTNIGEAIALVDREIARTAQPELREDSDTFGPEGDGHY